MLLSSAAAFVLFLFLFFFLSLSSLLLAPLQIHFHYRGLALPLRFLRVTSPVITPPFVRHALLFSLALRGTLDISCAGPTLTQPLPVFTFTILLSSCRGRLAAV